MRTALLFCIVASVQAIGRRNPRKTRQKADTGAANTKYATAISYSLDHSLDNGQVSWCMQCNHFYIFFFERMQTRLVCHCRYLSPLLVYLLARGTGQRHQSLN